MQKTNQLSKTQLETFNRAGWIVQPLKENEITEHIGQETMLHLFNYKGFVTRTINIDYLRETMLVVENDTRCKLCPHVKYDAPLPERVSLTLEILKTVLTIEPLLFKRLTS